MPSLQKPPLRRPAFHAPDVLAQAIGGFALLDFSQEGRVRDAEGVPKDGLPRTLAPVTADNLPNQRATSEATTLPAHLHTPALRRRRSMRVPALPDMSNEPLTVVL
jgi:hypothetical protein